MKSEIVGVAVEALPKHFEAQSAEKKWDEYWSNQKTYHYDSSRPKNESYIVDTPPPTVSGSLHIGHIFSYTHTDILVRHQRMRGKNIFYPMGWDDNGLPTERRVQNLFHVRCDPHLPYDPHLKISEPTKEELKERPKVISRQNFIELCHQVTKEDEKAFMNLFRRVGLSVDWRFEYATIDDHCRRLAQYSFLDLFQKGELAQVEAPTMWDVDFQTAVAQAEIEDRPMPGAFHHIRFEVEGGGDFVIATTRPELLPACVGVATHPDDPRYKNLIGKKAITPLFAVPVPIFASELVQPDKGTGILMVCTFGDATDVVWWREQKLATRQIIGRDGRLIPVRFGSSPWESKRTEIAQELYNQLQGKNVKQAQKLIVEMLRNPSYFSSGQAGLVQEPQALQHSVKFFEKGDRPLEFVTTRQWFVKLLKHKEALLEQGEKIKWYPDFMKSRYRNWTENLNLDWCVSRQRYFGVPIPVWYPLSSSGEVLYDQVILPKSKDLPLDPMSQAPEGYQESQRGKPGGFIGEADVFDTWFTSSLSPQIGSHWVLDEQRHAQLFPADLRPQSHEIIRTWAFYTIAKAYLHHRDIPWKSIAISGWILDPDRKKMSKSKGNVITPIHLLDEYSSDAVRYWAANARLGTDTAFDEQELKVGRRLTTKLYNAAKFVLAQSGPVGLAQNEIDLGFLAALKALVNRVTKSFDDNNFAQALQETEKFFWTQFTDTYLELVKTRAKEGNPVDRASALFSLRTGLHILLRLFAPYLPFITEEIWHWQFATAGRSIHREKWPHADELSDIASPRYSESFEVLCSALSQVHKWKTENAMSVGTVVPSLVLECHPQLKPALELGLEDLKSATRVEQLKIQASEKLSENQMTVKSA